uniref:Secreted protein n=1 Tax=Panagrellus redivivus TaxID=6233 RepID=A0A7E4UUV8_PANRE
METIVTFIIIAWLLETCNTTMNTLNAPLRGIWFAWQSEPSSYKIQFHRLHHQRQNAKTSNQQPRRRTTRNPFCLPCKHSWVKDAFHIKQINAKRNEGNQQPRRRTTCKMATGLPPPPKFDER